MAGRFLITGLAAAASGLLFVLGGTAATDSPAADDRPSISPIQAIFIESSRATQYEVRLDDPGAGPETEFPAWTWTLEPPADDPGCNKLVDVFKQRMRSVTTWHHADFDGCKHVGADHAGRIDVTVRVRGGWTCSATITGTTTHEGPEPELCFKTTPQPPPPVSSSAPSLSDLEKKQWRDTSAALAAAGASSFALAIGCAIVPSPDPVSKGLAIVGALVGLGQYAASGWAYVKWKDPPDPNYERLAKLVVPKLPPVRATSGVTAGEARAANALLENLARSAAHDTALIASFERAQGAYAKRDGSWDRRQSRAAAAFARAEAKLLDVRPALEDALARAVAQASVPPLTQADARRAVARVDERGLPASFAKSMAKLGFSRAVVNAVTRSARQPAAGSLTGPVASKFGTPPTENAYRTSAKLLRALAARLAKR